MAELYPFRALRYTAKAGEINSLICPPYDQIDGEEALLTKNPFNAVRLELPQENSADTAALLEAWKTDCILKQDTDPAFYICEQEFLHHGQTKKQKGLLCRVKIEDNSVLLPHKETDPFEVERRAALLRATSCECSPIQALYEDDEHKTMSRVSMLSSGKPRFTFKQNNVTQRLWPIHDLLIIRTICEDFAQRKLWVADGHHRLEAVKACGDSAYMMLTDFEQDGLTVLLSHCVVDSAAPVDLPQFLEQCSSYFQVISRETMSLYIADEIERNLDALYRQGRKAFGLYTGGATWTLLLLKDQSVMDTLLPEKSEAFRTLDSSILHRLVLEELLGMKISTVQTNATFTTSVETAISLVQSGSRKCAFLLNPARLKEIREIADLGEKMPPKSTCFYPAFPAGMLMCSNQL